MFENIIGQQPVVARLTKEVEAGILPSTLLFHGPDYSGKSSTALELSRSLTCTGTPTAEWRCGCRSCTLQRHLMHPDTLLLGGRYFNREIGIAADALKRDQRDALRFLFERSVRKLARRFDSVLWEGDEKRVSRAESLLADIDEQLASYLPGGTLPGDDEFADGIDRIVDVCDRLAAVVPLDAVPVYTVRRLSAWARTSTPGPAKIAIIENVDRLQESARNALLKTLEEPPKPVFFILTTHRRGAVIPTIRSRARSYGFLPRGPEDSAKVIERIFRDSRGDRLSIRDYFAAKDGQGLRAMAERYLESVVAGSSLELGLLEEITRTIKNLGGAQGFRSFVEEISILMETLLQSRDREKAGVSTRTLARWRLDLGKALMRFENFNTSATMALEGLYFGMREAVSNHAKVH